MAYVSDKYRGLTVYVRVMAEFVRAAEYRGLTTYQDVAVIMGLPTWGSHMGAEVGHILGEISEDEVNFGRPMLSALAVDVQGRVGSGFFALARGMGRLEEQDDEQAFWAKERDAAYAAWRRPLLRRDYNES